MADTILLDLKGEIISLQFKIKLKMNLFIGTK